MFNINIENGSIINVAPYARVSTDKDDQANSFESQVSYFTELINKNPNWNLVRVYADEGISGTSTGKRDQFNQMIQDALDGKIDRIITKEVSRFARNVVVTLEYTRLLKELGVYVTFTNDGIDTAEESGELRLTIMAAMAQEESRKTSERVKWGQKRRMEQGVVFGRDMLGYNVRDGKLELEPYGAEIVKQVFHKYAIEGKGSHVIARELKEAGIMPLNPDGTSHYKKDWSTTVILRILRNEKYVGDLCQKKTWTKNYLDHKKRYNRGEEEMVYLRDHHPDIAIISRELWDRTQAELARRSLTKEQKSKHSNRYWCSGKMWCGYCGERLVSRRRKLSDGSVYTAWLCVNHQRSTAFKSVECNCGSSVNEKSLIYSMRYIMQFLVANKAELKNELLSEIAVLRDEKSSNSTDHTKQMITKLNTKKSKLLELLLDGTISKSDYSSKSKEIDDKIQSLNRQMVELEAAITKKEQSISRMEQLAKEIEKLLDFEFTADSKILSAVTKAIYLYPDKKVQVQVTGLPCVFEVGYETSGRMQDYTTEISAFRVMPTRN